MKLEHTEFGFVRIKVNGNVIVAFHQLRQQREILGDLTLRKNQTTSKGKVGRKIYMLKNWN